MEVVNSIEMPFHSRVYASSLNYSMSYEGVLFTDELINSF